MKLIKLFGLAVIAALAMSAIGGAGTASAELPTLCKKKVEKCAAADKYVVNDQIQLKLQAGTTSDFHKQDKPAEKLVECQNSEIEGTITQAQPVEGETKLTRFSQTQEVNDKCTVPGQAFKVLVTVQNQPYRVWAEQKAGNTQEGIVKVEKPGAARIKFTLSQPFLVQCQYELKAANDIMEGQLIDGAATGMQSKVVFQDVGFKEQKDDFGTCENEGAFTATYDAKGVQGGVKQHVYLTDQ